MATSLQGGHWEATLFSPGYNLDWIKSCSIFSQPWQLLFLNDTWYHHAPSAPLPSFSQRHTWRGGVHGRRRNCWGLLQMRGQTPRLQHPCRAHTHNCLQVFVEVCVTCHLACDTRRESLRLAVLVVRAKWCIQSAIDRVCFFNGCSLLCTGLCILFFKPEMPSYLSGGKKWPYLDEHAKRYAAS